MIESKVHILIIFCRSFKRHESESITVGCIGYPNVGKSSTINKLLACKVTMIQRHVYKYSTCYIFLSSESASVRDSRKDQTLPDSGAD